MFLFFMILLLHINFFGHRLQYNGFLILRRTIFFFDFFSDVNDNEVHKLLVGTNTSGAE
jgi:hypothetical protein